MSHRGRVKLLESSMLLAEVLLDGNPTPKRVDGLLLELQTRRERMKEADMPLDEQDRELGRRPLRAQEHAEILQAQAPAHLRDEAHIELAVAGVNESRQRRDAEGRQRVQEKIAENEARGLHRNAPALEEEAVETPGSEQREQPEPAPADPPVAVAPAPVAPAPAPEPPSDAEAIEAAKVAGLRRVSQVAEGLERKTLQRMPAIRAAGRTLKTLEEAADVLIAELQPNHQDALRQVCDEHGLANWVVCLGAIARMADLQELNAGEFEDAWLNRQTARSGTAASAREERCQMCDGVIPPDPIRKNRVACCNRHGSGQVEHTAGCPLASLQMVKGKWVTVPAST